MKRFKGNGLLKSDKGYLLGSIACGLGAIGGLGAVIAAAGMDICGTASPATIIATAAVGLAVGTACSAVGTVLIGEQRQIDRENAEKENSEYYNYGLDVEM